MAARPSIDELKAGDAAAWAWLMDAFAGQVAGYARRMGCSDPEDITGSTLEAVARGIGGFFGSHAQLRSWVFTIAHGRIVDDLRRRQRRPEVGLTGVEEAVDVSWEPASGTGQSLLEVDDPDLEAALAQLTDDQRSLLHLRHVVGLSTKEIAAATDRSEVATRVALHRSSKRLRELLAASSNVSVGAA